jgi:hypothetical protein
MLSRDAPDGSAGVKGLSITYYAALTTATQTAVIGINPRQINDGERNVFEIVKGMWMYLVERGRDIIRLEHIVGMTRQNMTKE